MQPKYIQLLDKYGDWFLTGRVFVGIKKEGRLKWRAWFFLVESCKKEVQLQP